MGWWLAARHVTGKCCCLPLLLERLASLALVGPVEACSTPSISAEASSEMLHKFSQRCSLTFGLDPSSARSGFILGWEGSP